MPEVYCIWAGSSNWTLSAAATNCECNPPPLPAACRPSQLKLPTSIQHCHPSVMYWSVVMYNVLTLRAVSSTNTWNPANMLSRRLVVDVLHSLLQTTDLTQSKCMQVYKYDLQPRNCAYTSSRCIQEQQMTEQMWWRCLAIGCNESSRIKDSLYQVDALALCSRNQQFRFAMLQGMVQLC